MHARGAARRTSASRPITSSSRSATTSGPVQERRRASIRCCSRSSRARGRARRARASTVWAMVDLEADDALATAAARRRRRRARRAGDHLHARQGPRAVRRRQGRAARPAARASCSTPTACARSSACRPSRSPTGSRWSATRADGFPGLPGSGREDRGRGARPLRPHRGDPRRRQGVGRRRSARRRPARRDARRPGARSPTCSRCSRRCAPTPTSATVDDWEWTGPDARASRHGANGSARRGSLTRAAKLARPSEEDRVSRRRA